MDTLNELSRALNEISDTPEAKRRIAEIEKKVKILIKEDNKELKAQGLPECNWAIYKWPIELLSIDTYQRNPEHVDEIVSDFNYEDVDVKLISIRDGKAWIIDGSNTIQAMKKKGYTWIYAKTYIGLTKPEESAMFSRQDEHKRRVHGIVKYEADIEAGKKDAVEISGYLKSKKVTTNCIMRKPMRNNLIAIVKLRNIYKTFGITGVKIIIQLIFDAKWDKYEAGFASQYLDIGIALVRSRECKKRGDAAYKTIKDSMYGVAPDDWVSEANHHFENSKGQHGNGCITDYVRMLLGLIPDPLTE